MNRRWDVALIGDSFVDHVLTGFSEWPKPGQEAFAKDYVREAGGGCVITGCALAKFGRSAALFTTTGTGDADWLMRRIQSFGVDTSHARRVDRPTGLTFVVLFPDDRAMFSYEGANLELPGLLRDPSLAEQLAQSRHVHFALRPEREPIIALFEKLRSAGCSISIDTGWQEEWLRDPANMEVLRLATVYFPNELEAEAITGEKDPRAMLEGFKQRGMTSVAIKLGKKGAVLMWSGEFYECRGFQIDVVDTTGAGDAFDAGFIHALLANAPPQRCLETACLTGALSTRAAGALDALPTAGELEARL